MPTDQLPTLLVALLALPAAAAVVVALLGPRRPQAVRWVSLTATLLLLAAAGILAVEFAEFPRATPRTFQPEFVPGASPGDRYATTWETLSLAPPRAVQFYIGLDGLNVWLVVLTALLLVTGVLVSWTAVTERVHEFHALLLLLGTGMFGVFLAFDILLFYAFFELTLVPLFFLIG